MMTKSETTPRIIGQRDSYLDALFEIFKDDPNCIFITADNGAPSLDVFARELPAQFIQVGIAEQQMIGMAAGLAIEGKRVWTYCIAPFATTRVHEFVKLDVAAANLPVTILGVGAGHAYDNMGPSHHTLEDVSIMRVLPNLEIWSPADSVCAAELAEVTYMRKKPCYIRFDRSGVPNIYNTLDLDMDLGIARPVQSPDLPDVQIVATGIMVHRAIEVAKMLEGIGIDCEVVDTFRLKPIASHWLLDDPECPVVTLEEHFLAGGLGSIIAEIIADQGLGSQLLRLGRTDGAGFCFEYGGREAIQKTIGLDADSVCKSIQEWLNLLPT